MVNDDEVEGAELLMADSTREKKDGWAAGSTVFESGVSTKWEMSSGGIERESGASDSRDAIDCGDGGCTLTIGCCGGGVGGYECMPASGVSSVKVTCESSNGLVSTLPAWYIGRGLVRHAKESVASLL